MKKQFLLIVILTLLISSFVFAQNTNENCPPLYTHSILNNPSVQIVKIEVVDSNKFSLLPMFELNKDSIAKLIYYPEIAKRAGVQGDVVVKINLNNNGIVKSYKFIKGIGAGCDESALDILRKLKYTPAKIGDKNVNSEFEVWVKFDLNEYVDKPDILLNEIIYEENNIYTYKKLVLDKTGHVNYVEKDLTAESGPELIVEKKGEIRPNIFERLNDLIVSQCFLSYKKDYVTTLINPDRWEYITVKNDFTEKRVSSNGKGDPVGLWAILNILRHIQDQITWEEVKE